jgi:hypothetical protein
MPLAACLAYQGGAGHESLGSTPAAPLCLPLPSRQVLSPADVALYGGLCALATFDRSELQSKVIGSIGFREFLELHPQVRRAAAKMTQEPAPSATSPQPCP